MIVLDADPTRGIGALRSVRTVFKGGIRYDVAALRGALGIGRPQGPAGPVAHLSHARVAVAEPCLAQRRCVPPPAGATARR
jgi:hypothetical protein